MKALTHPVSSTKPFRPAYCAPALAARALVLLGWTVSASASTPPAAPCGASLGAAGGYPTFCSIPAAPTDVRSAAAFKAAVVDARLEGRRVTRQSAPDTFTLPLGDAAAFAADARAAAAYPATAGAPTKAESNAFAAGARDVASPPKRHRRSPAASPP